MYSDSAESSPHWSLVWVHKPIWYFWQYFLTLRSNIYSTLRLYKMFGCTFFCHCKQNTKIINHKTIIKLYSKLSFFFYSMNCINNDIQYYLIHLSDRLTYQTFFVYSNIEQNFRIFFFKRMLYTIWGAFLHLSRSSFM